MAENTKYWQLIDDYLSGKITDKNRILVDNKLTTDPEFKNEFELQKNIVNAIKDSRRSELKTRLENIKIHWYNTIPANWKIAASVTAVTIATIGAYFYFDNQSDQKSQLEMESIDSIEITTDVNEIPQKPTVIISELPEEGLEEDSNKPPETTVKKAEEPKVTAKNNRIEETVDEQMVPETNGDIEVIVPDLVDDFEAGEDLNMKDVTDSNINKISPVREDFYSNTEVKTLMHKKYNFHYQLSEGLLTLYGNFEDIPYEILEINSLEGKRLFLNYKNNYYMLLSTGSITALTPVTDTTLINELNIVKENK